MCGGGQMRAEGARSPESEGREGSPSVGEVRSGTDWDPVWTGPNPAVPVPVWDFPKNPGPLGLRSGHSNLAQDRPDPVWTGTP